MHRTIPAWPRASVRKARNREDRKGYASSVAALVACGPRFYGRLLCGCVEDRGGVESRDLFDLFRPRDLYTPSVCSSQRDGGKHFPPCAPPLAPSHFMPGHTFAFAAEEELRCVHEYDCHHVKCEKDNR